ncbi:putrescine oxidase [Actinoplanes sp. SE50]|uniref:flavin monoamine oxidase family protein n=1 Tax=unclassified Actinoplanes TaxID=2626549 RepID=UPI00023EC295|nr:MULTISPECIES: NAD(P)/FAD-dependent oxidoreductase [unclassified Actinoplanes]AEV84114.1 putrescine oxidase [Actinoplanes sp. SE50/110]ATO82506.1 putrescine oxidase [Actinoplanes sp. SE50]SLL99913.1 putrescine oxidase [Actinoplanes sp. SE50/110]
MYEQADVVVVGAGVTGLTAATRLAAAGLTVTVLEARDRVGGRLLGAEVDGVPLELGGQWISPDQTAALAMAEELGLDTFPRYRDGANVYRDRAGVRHTYTGAALPVSAATARAIEAISDEVERLAAETDPDRPWAHPDAERLDSISFADWLGMRTDDQEARDNVAMFLASAMLTKAADEFSTLSALHMAASAGGFSHLTDENFVLDRRVAGGLSQVPRLLAERLGDIVRLNSPVERITWDADGATVATADGSVRGRRVILALPPTLMGRITFEPALPEAQRQAQAHQSFGTVLKIQVAYPTPFWRAAGLSGTGFSPYQIVHEVYDNTNDDRPEDRRGVLVGFVSDRHARALLDLSPADRRAAVLNSLASYFGDEARQPVAYSESPWLDEKWTGGAYGTSFAIGAFHEYGRHLREETGPLSFGSADVAGLGYLHVDGAIRVGEELANASIKALK